MHANDSQLILEIVWDLVRQGILTFGVNASNLAWQWLRLTRFGEYALRDGPHRFHSNTGFMKALRSEAADISPEAVVYLREAVTAFYTDCLLSTCVMLSIAAESEFLRLLNVAKNSQAFGRHFSRIGDGLKIEAKISQFRDAINPILALLPKSGTNELDHNLSTVQSMIRTARNESGRPSGARPPSRDQVYLYLQLFISFARQAMRLRQELSEPAYPRRPGAVNGGCPSEQRRRAGIEAARARGVYRGQAPKFDHAKMVAPRKDGMGATEIAMAAGSERGAFYRVLKAHGLK